MKQGWKIMKLGDICEIARGGSPRPIQSYLTDDSNGVNWIKIGDTEVGGKYISSTKERIKRDGMRSSRYVEVGDFLLSNSMSFGRPYILKVDGCIHDGWLVIKNYENTFIQDFLYYLLLSPNVAKQFEESARGSTVRNLNTNIVSQTSVIVPPLSEQQRIVSLLDAEFAKIDALKANAEKNLQNAKDLFQAALKKELEPKEGWMVKTLKEIGLTQTGMTPKTSVKENYGDYIPFIKPADVNIDGLGNLNYNNEGLSEQGAKSGRVFDANSILMVCIGATIGKVGYAKQKISSNQQINVLTPYEGYNSKFLYYCMASPSFQFKVIKEGESAKATLPIINKSKWESLLVAIPAIFDQQSIVSRLDTLNDKCKVLQANYEKTLSLCDDLKQALLRKAFNGEI